MQVIVTAFEDCATMTATFKLLDSFEGLLDRSVIAQVRTSRSLPGVLVCSAAPILCARFTWHSRVAFTLLQPWVHGVILA